MARRGRKRKQGNREPNGRLSRRPNEVKARGGETEQEAMSTVIEMRMRAGIPQHLARSVGTLEAALFASEQIDRAQYEASVFYLTCRLKYLSSIEEPHSPKEPKKAGTGVFDPDAHAKFCARAREVFEDIRGEVMKTQESMGMTSNLFAALDCLERGHLQTYQVDDLRQALNAVDRYRSKQKRVA